jgi:hypothetical protein
VVADTAQSFLPLEAAIRTCFILAILGIPSTKVDGKYCQLLTHSVKLGGLEIHNPVDTAPSVHAALLATTCHLTVSLVDTQTLFDLGCTTSALLRLAKRLKRIGSKMSKSFSTAKAGANLLW